MAADLTPQRTIGNRAVARLFGAQSTFVTAAASNLYEREHVQRSVGNRSMTQLIGSGTVQAKLQVGPAGDRYEQEADRVADEVMRRRRAPSATSAQAEPGPDSGADSPQIRRAPAGFGTVGLKGGTLPDDSEREVRAARTGGQRLPAGIRGSMEQAMGADFGAVRVHGGAGADALSRSMQPARSPWATMSSSRRASTGRRRPRASTSSPTS